jgi:hypothetical protein
VNSRNPNFGMIKTFENIELTFEPLLWPMLEITISDDSTVFGVGGCEECYTTIPLFEFADSILSEEDIKFSKV